MSWARRAGWATVVLGTLVAVLAVPAGADTTTVPAPTVEHLPDDVGLHGHPLWDPWFDPAEFGYEAHEYLVAGTARATGSDATAAYTTRIIVVRPTDPADFAGTVLLDWVNVTAQFENAVNSLTSIQFLLREGWAFVHVSAQAAGVCCTPLTPTVWDPLRYGALSHPGDEYSNDMFSQVAQAVRGLSDVDPMGGLDVEVVIAAGQSQSASRLSDYVATTAADHGVIDALLIQAGGSKTYEVAPSVPVIHLLGDREGTPGEPTAWPTYRLWEVASSAHADSWIGRQQTEGQSLRLVTGTQRSRADAEALWASAGNLGETVGPQQVVCVVNGAIFPTRYAANAALATLDRWVRDDTPAPQPPRYEFTATGLATDAFGNTAGGLRLPPADHPLARHLSDLCELGGISIPLTPVELLAAYGDHAAFYALTVAATEASVADGYLLVHDALDLLERSCAARPLFLDTSTGPCLPTPSFDTGTTEPAPTPDPAPIDDPATPDVPADSGGTMPATGGGVALAGLALAGLALAAVAVGRRR